MKKYVFLSLLTFSLTIGLSQKKQQEQDYSEAFTLIDVWLEAQKDFDQLPGITAAVIKDQDVMWKGAYGWANPSEHIEAEPSTLFSICSISKLFTAVAIMKLYDEGKLRLDDKIEEILPWFDLEQQYKESGPITIRSLLTHSSGLPREAHFPYWTGPDYPFPTQDQIRADLKKQETLYPSSTYFQYSNLGLTLLGEIVAEVSGISYEQYVMTHILEPLALNNTRPELPEDLYGTSLAIGYGARLRKGDRAQINFFQANGIAPAAGFSSNVVDLGKFASWQFRLLDSTDQEILTSSTLKYMQQVHYTDPGWETTWGLGFAVRKGSDGQKWVSHGGSCPGYRTILMMNPQQKMAYSVMINANGTNPGQYANGIHQILKKYESAEKEEDKDANEEIPAKDLSEYVGYYSVQPWWSEDYIGSWKGKLISLGLPADSPGKSTSLYKHIEDDTFRRVRDDGELGETLIFERGEQGNISSYKVHDNYYQRIVR